MQYISGKVIQVGEKVLIKGNNYDFSKIVLIIKKKMDGKFRNICFECIGKLADKIFNEVRLGDRIDVKYYIDSRFKNNHWFTTLHAKDFEKIIREPKIKDEQQLNFYAL